MIELILKPKAFTNLNGKVKYQSERWIEKYIEIIASWYQQQIQVTNVKVDVYKRRFLKITAKNGEIYSQMITDPDQDGNYPLMVNKINYGMTGQIISFQVNL